jgi:hypothetical protein
MAYAEACALFKNFIGWRMPEHLEDCRRDWARLVIGYGCRKGDAS